MEQQHAQWMWFSGTRLRKKNVHMALQAVYVLKVDCRTVHQSPCRFFSAFPQISFLLGRERRGKLSHKKKHDVLVLPFILAMQAISVQYTDQRTVFGKDLAYRSLMLSSTEIVQCFSSQKGDLHQSVLHVWRRCRASDIQQRSPHQGSFLS